MKSVTIDNVKARIAQIEANQDGMKEYGFDISIPANFELACLRKLVELMQPAQVAEKPDLHKVIYHFRDWNEGFPVERFKAEYVISWMLANYPPAPIAPVTGVDDDVRNVVALLENNEWAEHCTKTVLGSRLETEITRLVGSSQPAPVAHNADPSFDAMMRALDAFYADDDVPERAMLAAFKILLADVRGQVQEPATDNTAQQFEALATSNAHDCLWSYDSHQGTWHGKCGVCWVFMDDGPDENGMKFCPGCGKPVATTSAGSGNP